MSPRQYVSLVFLVFSAVFGEWANSAEVLFVCPMPSHSHQIVFRPMWEALARQGHHVTVVTPNPARDPKFENVTEIDVGGALYEIAAEVYEKLNGLSAFKVTEIFQDAITRMSVKTLEHPQMQNLIVNKTSYRFDVVIVESLFFELLALGHHFDAPTILVSSFDVQGVLYESFGNPRHPIAQPDYVLPLVGELTFKERITAVLAYLYLEYVRKLRWYPIKRREMARFFGEGVPDLATLLDGVELLLVNVNHVIDGPRPLGPNTIAFGAGVHIRGPEELPEDLKTFLDSGPEGVVYFSLGSNILWNSDDFQSKLRDFLEVFEKLPFKILAKYSGKELESIPKNVKIVDWVPQQDILRHPHVKCFITQGGRQSLEEAIYINVPMVVLPMFGDQYQNGKKIQRHGIGRLVRHIPVLDKGELLDAVLDVARNETYKASIARLARLALDRPMTGLEEATWWTEHVIRNRGANHLRNHSVGMPLYQTLLLDVLALLVTGLTGTVVLATVTVRFMVRRWSRRGGEGNGGKGKEE